MSSDALELGDRGLAGTPSQRVFTSPDQMTMSNTRLGHNGIPGQHLEPADGGFAAWRLLLAAFVFEALLWGRHATPCPVFPLHPQPILNMVNQGFPLSFGVFQNYYSQLPQFANSPYISIVGTTASGISYLGAPFVAPLIKRYSRYQRQMIWVGCMSLVSQSCSCS